MAVTTSDMANGCNNTRVRVDDETCGVVVTPNTVAVSVVILEDDNGDTTEGDEDDGDE